MEDLRNFIIVALSMALGVSGFTLYTRYEFQETRNKLEATFFPYMALRSFSNTINCNSGFIIPTKSSIGIYCEPPIQSTPKTRKEIINFTMFHAKEWAKQNRHINKYLSVSFTDEFVSGPRD